MMMATARWPRPLAALLATVVWRRRGAHLAGQSGAPRASIRAAAAGATCRTSRSPAAALGAGCRRRGHAAGAPGGTRCAGGTDAPRRCGHQRGAARPAAGALAERVPLRANRAAREALGAAGGAPADATCCCATRRWPGAGSRLASGNPPSPTSPCRCRCRATWWHRPSRSTRRWPMAGGCWCCCRTARGNARGAHPCRLRRQCQP